MDTTMLVWEPVDELVLYLKQSYEIHTWSNHMGLDGGKNMEHYITATAHQLLEELKNVYQRENRGKGTNFI